MTSSPLLDNEGIIFLFLYLFSLIGIGILVRFSKKEDSLGDFYLAGRGMGGFVFFAAPSGLVGMELRYCFWPPHLPRVCVGRGGRTRHHNNGTHPCILTSLSL